MKTIVLVFHGTSQDQSVLSENTVQLARMGRDLGYTVVEFGGPGSTERTVTTFIQNEGPGIYTMGESLEDMGSLGLEFIWPTLGGIATGSGVSENLIDAAQVVRTAISKNYTEIIFVGFSRGGDTVAQLLPILEKNGLLGRFRSIKFLALDPVAGPFKKKLHTIPSSVSKFKVIYAQHEGRPGFGASEFIVDENLDFEGESRPGVHGDVGGSTKSLMAKLNFFDSAEFVFGKPMISPQQRFDWTWSIMADSERYTNPHFGHSLSPRKERQLSGVGAIESNELMLPSAGSFSFLYGISSTFRSLLGMAGSAVSALSSAKVDLDFEKINAQRRKIDEQIRETDKQLKKFNRSRDMKTSVPHRSQNTGSAGKVISPNYMTRHPSTGVLRHAPPSKFNTNPYLAKTALEMLKKFPK